MNLADLIIEYRKSHALSQRQMGAQCGLSTGYISLIEKEINPQTGKQMVPTLNVLNKLASGMNMSIDELFSACDDMPVNISESKAKMPETTSIRLMTIGERIKQRREQLQMTQDELAKRLGYKSRSSINKIELGQQNLTQSKIYAIAIALETTPSFIMGWEEGHDQKEKPAPNEEDRLNLEIMDLFLSLPEEKQKEALSYLRYLAESARRK